MNVTTHQPPLRGRTVGEISVAVPGATEVFRRFKLDFCFGGDVPRDDAARQHSTEAEVAIAAADPHSSSSLVPMLVGGLVLTVVGMLVALAFS